MQGSAADLIKFAMLAVDAWIIKHNAAAKIILQVHDELVLEVAKDSVDEVTKATTKLMAKVAKLKVPLVVDTGNGDNWRDAH